ncbi:hypothetical protein JW960_10710 [candidate division KSB1 bacterium]|nr:hypothetical protein [candidate division KSB1 bacterium]
MKKFVIGIILLVGLSLSQNHVYADASWEIIRQADWGFIMQKVKAINADTCWILGLQNQLLHTKNGGLDWEQYRFTPEQDDTLKNIRIF